MTVRAGTENRSGVLAFGRSGLPGGPVRETHGPTDPPNHRTTERVRRGAPGFTLVEVVVAIGVIGTVLLALTGTFLTSYTNVDYGGRLTRASEYTHQKAEDLRNTPFATLANGNDVPETAFTRTWTVTLAGTSPNRLATVTASVSFLSQTGRPSTVQVVTQIAE